MLRNLIYYICPFPNGVWQDNVRELARYWSIFNGRSVVSIAQGPGLEDAAEVKGQIIQETMRQPQQAGANVSIEFQTVVNQPNFGEAPHFFSSLEQLESTDEREITFYAHTKGVTKPTISGIKSWRDRMYAFNLRDPADVEAKLKLFPCAGCFRRVGPKRRKFGAPWHFSGSFFWFRHDAAFSRNWYWPQKGDGFYASEGWPGALFSLAESHCFYACDEANSDFYGYSEIDWKNLDIKYQMEI